MRVTVTGATGTIGRALVRALRSRGDSVTVLARDPGRARGVVGDVEAHPWPDAAAEPPPVDSLSGRDGVVHLLGEPVTRRWTEDARRTIRDSRVLGTRNLVAALEGAQPRPPVLVSSSASGYYGPCGDEPVDESEPPGEGFLAEVCAAWEAEARRAERLGVRVAIARTGIVLSRTGGALGRMTLPFKLGIGGPVAGGRQYMPWIHLDDEVGALLFCLDTPAAAGPVNLSAPRSVTNREFSKSLGRVFGRPAVAPVPGLALRLLYGEMGSIVTTGVRMVPARLEELGYRFEQPDLDRALRSATGRAG